MCAPTPTAAHAENVAEDVAEYVANITGEATTAMTVFEGGMPMLVIHRALSRIAEDLVGFLGFLEPFLRLWIIRAAIRMTLHGQSAECLLQVIFRGTALDARATSV